MYVVVGENWYYHVGVGEERRAETAAVRAAQGGKDRLTGEERAGGGGQPPAGLIARLIAVDPDNVDGPNLVLWVWESREHALAAGGSTAILAREEVTAVQARVASWMDWSRATIRGYDVLYFAHRDSGV